MRFADFIVTSALQSLTRSLVRVCEPGARMSGSDAKALFQTAQQLRSLWQIVGESVTKTELGQARADLKELVALCLSDRIPELDAARRLLEKAEGKSAKHLADIIAQLADGVTPASPLRPSQGRLGTLLQAESRRWREDDDLRRIEETELIEGGMVRVFRTAKQRVSDLCPPSGQSQGASPTPKQFRRAGRWVGHCARHLELLKPALSDSGRVRLWHLNRLVAKLDEQWALERLARTAVAVDLKPKASVRIGKLIRSERGRLAKQQKKLSQGVFEGGVKTYRRELKTAVAQLGLEFVALPPVEEKTAGERQALEEI